MAMVFIYRINKAMARDAAEKKRRKKKEKDQFPRGGQGYVARGSG